MNVEFGNAGSIDTNETGWFIGFSEWMKSDPHNLRFIPRDLSLNSLCVKWGLHTVGSPNGEEKPISEGRTMSMLVSERGRFRLNFDNKRDFSSGEMKSFLLEKHGDFVIWGPGIYHSAYCEQDSAILTLRWFDCEPVV